MGGLIIEEDLFVKNNLIDLNSVEGQKIHAFLMERAQLLAGHIIDFEKTPVTFVLSDRKNPNAFFMPAPQDIEKPERSRDDNKRYEINPVNTAVIAVTKGLIHMVDNVDQLDYVLGHELTHMIIDSYGIEGNSKGEEELADLHAVDLMYDAGSDPKQALKMEEKFSAYAKEQKQKESRRRYRYPGEQEPTVHWSEILDVHMAHSNRSAALEASLTRLSHLIDDRMPSKFDKSVFDVEYTDPVTEFLKARDYDGQQSLGKLKILIDCVEHISNTVPPEYFVTQQMEETQRNKTDSSEIDWDARKKLEAIQKSIESGYKNYFRGKTIEKKYQQKLAHLTEKVMEQISEDREDKTKKKDFTPREAADLHVYLQNKAYAHIREHGYPDDEDINYLHASGILYTYFYNILEGRILTEKRPRSKRKNTGHPVSGLELDITLAKKDIYEADSVDAFKKSTERFKYLTTLFQDMRSKSYGYNGSKEKFDNLSFFYSFGSNHDRNLTRLYTGDYDVTPKRKVPWDNLVSLAKENDDARDEIVNFLAEHRVEDFRITHNKNYVRRYEHDAYAITKKGLVSKQNLENYELEYAVYNQSVRDVYAYIRDYFKTEAAFFDQAREEILGISEAEFTVFQTEEDKMYDISNATKKVSAFTQLYDSLPEGKNPKTDWENTNIRAFMAGNSACENPMPCTDKDNRFELDEKLLDLKNPVFIKHFGADFKEDITTAKNLQKEKMFDTAFESIKIAADMWADAAGKMDALKELIKPVRQRVGDVPYEEQAKHPEAETLRGLYEEESLLRSMKGSLEGWVYNYCYSALESKNYRFYLTRLTQAQRDIIADYVVRDEKGLFHQIFREGTSPFCDFLNILSDQTDLALSGHYELTEMMGIVAKQLGHAPAETKEDFKNFVDTRPDNFYDRTPRYKWYLHAFDAMRYLEKNADINIHSLTTILSKTRVFDPQSQSHLQKIEKARYKNYIKFITHDRVLRLVSKAVDLQSNYSGLALDELMATADSLASLRKEIGEFLNKGGQKELDEGAEKITRAKHLKFLNLLDKNIRGVLRKAEYQALLKSDPYTRIKDLYRLYNSKDKRGSRERSFYIKTIQDKEQRSEAISQMSENPDFWPQDEWEHVQAYVFGKNTFLDDIDLENRVLNNVLDKIEHMPPGKKKNECFFTLLDKNYRAAYPETRQRLFDLYVEDIAGKLGRDDGSETYRARLGVYIKALEGGVKKGWDIGKEHGQRDGLLSNSISSADKYMVLRQLADEILSQEQTSSMIKKACEASLNSKDLARSYMYGIGVDYLTEEMDSDPESARKFVQFLNSKGEFAECKDMSDFMVFKLNTKHKDNLRYVQQVTEKIKPVKCKVLYENFWSAPLEARAVIIARMLKSAVNENSEGGEASLQSWERVFDVVMDNLIHPDDTSIESKYARDIMHSYIKSRSDYERDLIMSAMMVANRNIGSDAGNVGKALKLFLENMGPAEIKLGQAISSHPNTPDSIRTELQDLKNQADMPARWSIYDWIKAEKIPAGIWKNKYLGPVLGSASYYTTIALGDDKVMRLLRPEAREKANKGFRVIGDMIEDLKEKDMQSGLNYADLTAAVAEMVKQAAKMSHIETDHDLGQTQYEQAQRIYNGASLQSGKEVFNLQTMDWSAKGKNWIIMRRARGPIYNNLPEDTAENIDYKKSFAKAYITFEMTQILSGQKFDHDRHGAQLCIDPETNDVGIFDTGAMALNCPAPQDQKILGHVMYDVMKRAVHQKHSFMDLATILNDKIEHLYEQNIDTQYLVEVKKGMLALGDFFKILDQDEIEELLTNMDVYAHMSPHIKAGFSEKMSMAEKAKLAVLFATKASSKDTGRAVVSRAHSTDVNSNVRRFDDVADTQRKASWLQHIFADQNAENAKKDAAKNNTDIPSGNYKPLALG